MTRKQAIDVCAILITTSLIQLNYNDNDDI